MTNWKADPKVQEILAGFGHGEVTFGGKREGLTMQIRTATEAEIDALCEAAVAASGSPPREPTAWLFQHDEGGRQVVIGAIDLRNMRNAKGWNEVGPLYLGASGSPPSPTQIVAAMLKGLGADGSHLCGVTDAFGEREAEEIGRFARKLIDKSNAKRASSGSTGAPDIVKLLRSGARALAQLSMGHGDDDSDYQLSRECNAAADALSRGSLHGGTDRPADTGEPEMKPRLVFSPLGERVYVVTRYTERSGTLTAHTKYDVTEDFHEAMKRVSAGAGSTGPVNDHSTEKNDAK